MHNNYLYGDKTMRVTLPVLAISFMITACTTLQGINETIKGDGVPYIPGI